MISYSLSYRKVTVKNSDGQMVVAYKAYATARALEHMSSDEFLDHTARQLTSLYTKADYRAIMAQISEGLIDKVADGYKVPLPGFGYCYPSLSACSVDNAEDFVPSRDIKKVSVGWSRSYPFANFKESGHTVTFRHVLTQVNEAYAIQADSIGLNSFTLHSTASKTAAFE